MSELLRRGLAGIAESVRSVDLYDGVLRDSRTIGRRRTAAVLGGVLALVLAVVLGTTQLVGRPRAAQWPAASPSMPVAVATSAPPAVPPPSASVPPTPVTVGGLLYAAYDQASPDAATLYSWRPGTADATAGPKMNWESAQLTANYTSDGERVVWVDRQTSALHVAAADGTGDRVVATGVDSMCVEPVWLPDNKRILTRTDKGFGILTMDTGAFKPLPAEVHGCHFTFSADGKTMAYATGDDGRVVLANIDGSNRRYVPGLGADTYRVYAVVSLSHDGSRVAVYRLNPHPDGGDAARSLWTNAILDTRTGAVVPMPVSGKVVQVLYRPDGSTLVRLDGPPREVVLVSASGAVVSRHKEPATLKTTWLLGEKQ